MGSTATPITGKSGRRFESDLLHQYGRLSRFGHRSSCVTIELQICNNQWTHVNQFDSGDDHFVFASLIYGRFLIDASRNLYHEIGYDI